MEKNIVRTATEVEMFTKLYEEHFERLEKRAQNIVGTAFSADVVHDLFLAFWESGKWKNINPEGNVMGYLWQSCLNIAKRHYLDNNVVNGYDIVFGEKSLQSEPEIFKGLKGKIKSIIIGYFVFGYTETDLAKHHKTSRYEIRTIIQKFLKKVKPENFEDNEVVEGFCDDDYEEDCEV